MTTAPYTLVTILVEPEIAERLAEELLARGARGYSMTPGRGVWKRGLASASGTGSDWEGANVRIETVVRPAVAEAIFAHLRAHYFSYYAVFAYATAVSIERPERYD
jgi:nitrogen regulatory protein P-II 2